MSKSSIEWTGSTWNPIRARNRETGQAGTHCVKISPGCAHCYAETHNLRNLPKGSSGLPYTAVGAALAEYFIDQKMLVEPLRRKKPEVYFPCSLTDLFYDKYGWEIVAAVYAVMAVARQHTFQVLTKRPEKAAKLYELVPAGWNRSPANSLRFGSPAARDFRHLIPDDMPWPLPNVWLGVSVEDRRHGLPRIDILRQIPAALRFLSIEPLLEDLGEIDLTGIGWVIVGGESGHGARPFDIAWARSIIAQCRAAGVPVFVKQVGAAPCDGYLSDADLLLGGKGRPRPLDQPLGEEGARAIRAEVGLPRVRRRLRVGDRKGGKPEEWPEDLRVREMPVNYGAPEEEGPGKMKPRPSDSAGADLALGGDESHDS